MSSFVEENSTTAIGPRAGVDGAVGGGGFSWGCGWWGDIRTVCCAVEV